MSSDEDDDVLCDIGGLCVASRGANRITNCIFCGKELIEVDGLWYTWDADILTKNPMPQMQE